MFLLETLSPSLSYKPTFFYLTPIESEEPRKQPGTQPPMKSYETLCLLRGHAYMLLSESSIDVR